MHDFLQGSKPTPNVSAPDKKKQPQLDQQQQQQTQQRVGTQPASVAAQPAHEVNVSKLTKLARAAYTGDLKVRGCAVVCLSVYVALVAVWLLLFLYVCLFIVFGISPFISLYFSCSKTVM